MAVDRKSMQASHELEEMLPHLREIVNEIREGRVNAYGALYEARHRLGLITRNLGAGIPKTSGHNWDSQ
jgi:alkylated DNA nucleotide flippase Atl1